MKSLLILFAIIMMATSYPYFNQCSQPWGSQLLGWSDVRICNYGCLMTSYTMAADGCGYSFDPSSMNEWLKNNGGFFDGGNLYFAAMNRLGITYRGQVGTDRLREFLDAGYIVISHVRSQTHWVLDTGYSGDAIYCNDSGFGNSYYNIGGIAESLVYTPPGLAHTLKVDVQPTLEAHQGNLHSFVSEK